MSTPKLNSSLSEPIKKNRNGVKFISFLMLVALVTGGSNTSCTKPSPSAPSPRTDTTTNLPSDTTHSVDTSSHPPPTDTSSLGIYIGGSKMNAEGWDDFAAYWKNDSLKQVSAMPTSSVTGILVNKKDVYITIASGGRNPFSYLKNGVPIASPPDELGYDHDGYGIAMLNGDVYTTGTAHQAPSYNYCAIYQVNNNNLVYLAPPAISVHDSWGYAIAAINNDIYVAGHFGYKGTYWKNGQQTQLPVDSTDLNLYSRVNSVCADNANIYMAGFITTSPSADASYDQGALAVYWKNDSLVKLSPGTRSVANSIAVVNGNVYVAGSVFGTDLLPRAAWWKNGELHILDSRYSEARAIAIRGSDIYIAGHINYAEAVYWKNEAPVSLGRGRATSIFIAE